jgi:hypothetical protein
MLDGGFIVAIIAALMLKGFVFPKGYILYRLQFFKDQILTDKQPASSFSTKQEAVIVDQDNTQGT